MVSVFFGFGSMVDGPIERRTHEDDRRYEILAGRNATWKSINVLPPSVRFLGKSLSRAPKNPAWNRFEEKNSTWNRFETSDLVVWPSTPPLEGWFGGLLTLIPMSVCCPTGAIRRGSSRPFHRGVKLPKIPQNDLISGMKVNSLNTSQTEGVRSCRRSPVWILEL